MRRQAKVAEPSERDRYRIPALPEEERRRRQACREVLLYRIGCGEVVRGTACEMADSACAGRIEAHHEDYSKPLAVRWLCRHHHLRVDGPKMARFRKVGP